LPGIPVSSLMVLSPMTAALILVHGEKCCRFLPSLPSITVSLVSTKSRRRQGAECLRWWSPSLRCC